MLREGSVSESGLSDASHQHTNASDLAQMGYCERQVVFKYATGDRATPAQRKAREEGEAAHRHAHELALASQNASRQAPDSRCFVASCLYGIDDPRTDLLRAWRDRVLQPRMSGRVLISAYYSAGPAMVRLLQAAPRLRGWTRALMDALVRRIAGRS